MGNKHPLAILMYVGYQGFDFLQNHVAHVNWIQSSMIGYDWCKLGPILTSSSGKPPGI